MKRVSKEQRQREGEEYASCSDQVARRLKPSCILVSYRSAEALRHPKTNRYISRLETNLSLGGNSWRGLLWLTAVWGPSTAHDVHFVGVMLRSG
jgi:hypothetical protein